MRCHCDNLYVAESRLHGNGVFCSVTLRRGDFVGVYSGQKMSMPRYLTLARRDPTLSEYAMEVNGGIVIGDPRRDLMAVVNEPAPKQTANVGMVVLVKNERTEAVAYYAASTIRPHTELCVHYGSQYHKRSYAVGKRAPTLYDVELRVPPRSALCARAFVRRR